ncbi:NitT/TauT family transport system substrate-binding protein [Agromyces sp. CF514]|uniref:ABC transporter substrate-binding protein n=1 Tax=Agromyces sp. CF514 TaxID=1881031 RepID=UPI0008E1A2A9|nr:ABC transporter substrate-binding protein [Agromyces sp. CF514]SFR91000.1 NitT/TauT family transport system substrate-binding protein [Agromyces sp. CF514]
MKHSTRRGLAAGAFAVTAAFLLAACSSGDSGDSGGGDSGELTSVKLQLQWLPQGQFAGYFAAVDQGFFEDEGLDVEIIPSGGDIVPQDALANGDVDYAIAWVPKVLGSIEQGANLTDIAQIFQRSGTLQVSWADSGIDSVADFEGKKIGSWGFGNEWEIFAAMAAEGLDASTVQIITQDFNMNAFLQGDIDAAQAMTYNEYAQLLETVNPDTGELYQPEDFNVISYEDTEGAMLQDAIWADTERLESDSEYADTTVKFLKAVIKGWAFAAANPQDAADITIAAGSGWGPSHELWMVNETNKLIWPSDQGIGVIDETAWDKTVAGALAAVNETGAHLITEEPPASAWSNEYIEKALSELEGEDLDLTGADWKPIDVTLEEGGN